MRRTRAPKDRPGLHHRRQGDLRLQWTWATATLDTAAPAPEHPPARQVVDWPAEIGGQSWRITCVDMGNPPLRGVLPPGGRAWTWPRIGPQFEHARYFPDRINTEFIRVVNPSTIKMRVWERGSGETLACGTGACAAVVAGSGHGPVREGPGHHGPGPGRRPGGELHRREGHPPPATPSWSTPARWNTEKKLRRRTRGQPRPPPVRKERTQMDQRERQPSDSFAAAAPAGPGRRLSGRIYLPLPGRGVRQRPDREYGAAGDPGGGGPVGGGCVVSGPPSGPSPWACWWRRR